MTKDTQGEIWEVFIQQKTGQPHKHAASVHATDKEMALQNARDTYTRRNERERIDGRTILPAYHDQWNCRKWKGGGR